MTNTGTRTAASATSKSKDTTINTRWQMSVFGTKKAFPSLFKPKIWLTFASVRRHSSVSDVWGVCGLTKVRRAFRTHRWWRVTRGGQHPRPWICSWPRCEKKIYIYLYIAASELLLFTGLFLYLQINHLHRPEGIGQPSSSNFSAILWCHWVGLILTKRASIGGMKLFLTSCR